MQEKAMGNWLEQVLKLLSTETGSLTYHLVLSFSIAGALQLALNQGAHSVPARRQRMLLGLGVLLTLQLILFTISGLSWQAFLIGEQVLPPLDRAFYLLSIVLIVWLWCYPDPSPLADAGTLLLGLMAAAAAVMGALWWPTQPVDLPFNRLPVDVAAQFIGLAILLFGALSLLARKPEAWGYGLFMFLCLATGNGLHLLLPPSGGDYPIAVRLCQMIAYPFLFLLGQRFPVAATQPSPPASQALAAAAPPAETALPGDPQTWQTLHKLAAESDSQQLARGIAELVSRTFEADLCLLLSTPDVQGKIFVRSAYDRHAQRHLQPAPLDSRQFPTLTSALRMGRARRLPGDSAAPDLAALAQALGLEKTGNLLLTPVLAPDGQPTAGLLLLSPASGKDWNPGETAALGILGKLLVQFLQRSQEMIGLKQDLAQTRQNLRLAQEQAQQATEERQKLRDQLAVLQENSQRDHQQLVALAGISAAHQAAQQALADLRAENEQLKQAALLAEKSLAEKTQALGGELRLALEEIALLRQSLGEAEEKITALKLSQPEAASTGAQLESIAAIAQDMRQPLASISGYIDFLLGETIGILGANQRKYLERMRISVERISRLLDDLMQVASPESSAAHLEFEEVDVAQVLQRAVAESNRALHEKRISLNLDLPQQPLLINTDRHALKKVFGQLLSNAGAASPQGGSVRVKARLETSDSDLDYVLVQVADSGGGIAPQDMLHVFSLQSAAGSIQGLGASGAELSRMKTLVEALGGRAWVDSDPGNGAIFSVLLPVKKLFEGGNGRGENR
jgi:signal transduction histidine kinase